RIDRIGLEPRQNLGGIALQKIACLHPPKLFVARLRSLTLQLALAPRLFSDLPLLFRAVALSHDSSDPVRADRRQQEEEGGSHAAWRPVAIQPSPQERKPRVVVGVDELSGLKPLELLRQLFGGGVALAGVAGHRFSHDGGEIPRHARLPVLDRNWL